MTILAAIAAAGALSSGGVFAQDAQVLLKEHKCYVCHADRETATGPAFADVAQKYKGKRAAATDVAAAIRGGIQGGAPWHMPPHPEITEAEARAMAAYILSLPP